MKVKFLLRDHLQERERERRIEAACRVDELDDFKSYSRLKLIHFLNRDTN